MRPHVYWEKINSNWWSSPAGYVQERDGTWSAYVYHNLRTGKAWTECKTGFTSAAAARQWVERHAEE